MHSIKWEYCNLVRIVSAIGAFERLVDFLPDNGRILLVTTAGFTRRGLSQKVIEQLGKARVLVFDEITPNPELNDLDQATTRFVPEPITGIVAIGGGSVMDAAKVLSVTLPCGFSHPLHKVLREASGHQWQKNLPVIAVPTTSGTGAEVTPFATVWDGRQKKKHSVTGELIYPQLALLDPELTLSLPEQETLYTALDAISHSLESLWNNNRTPVSEAFATQALRLAIGAFPIVLGRPGDLTARAKMQQASMLAGLAISQTRTAIAHSISYPLTIHYGVPHGLACSFTLIEIWKQCRYSASEILNTDFVMKTMEMLEGLNLANEMNKYVREEDVVGLIGEMFAPERAGNYIMGMDRLALEKILQLSLKK
ncbi:MAG: phosphonoacetaldehyde reductase [Nitrospirae bacterium]|nr:phosphonoacetaldehyde reductase [Candidatus Troglogloeales bacterium]MBI3598816.1 phosphonoacetaldehyde reductase [Candidatus Troglogloeales bacterium]